LFNNDTKLFFVLWKRIEKRFIWFPGRKEKSNGAEIKKMIWKFIPFIGITVLVLAFVEEIPPSEDINAELSPELIVEEAHEPRFFAAVIDAGSTGTRLHLFEFRHSLATDSAPFELVREVFKEVKPGLSSFASEPKEAANSVKSLLSHAKTVIPSRLLSHTPIVVQATAGLRLLPGNEAEEIINEVKAIVKSAGFLLGDEAVGILSGLDEGVFGWFTLNFLSGRLNFGDDTIAFDHTAAFFSMLRLLFHQDYFLIPQLSYKQLQVSGFYQEVKQNKLFMR
jgi:hypothetical protein